MALIDANHETLAEDHRKFLEDAYKNTRILIVEYDKAIYGLTHEERKSYSMDTGQTTINVTRQDLPSLISHRKELMDYLNVLAEELGITEEKPKLFQGNPAW
jgi:predicted glycosyltransferase